MFRYKENNKYLILKVIINNLIQLSEIGIYDRYNKNTIHYL